MYIYMQLPCQRTKHGKNALNTNAAAKAVVRKPSHGKALQVPTEKMYM